MSQEFAVKVVKIEAISSIPKADKLEIAHIAGWQCVVAKNSFPVGSLAVYIPIDSILPDAVESILFGPDAKVKLSKSRVKTIKLRGAISQGMLAPCSELNVLKKLGHDCTKQLGITKFEPPEAPAHMSSGKQGTPRKKNPHFKEYGGLDNFKNYPDLFKTGEEVIITEKIHGTNFRCGWVLSNPDTILKKIKKFFGLLPKYEFVFGSNRVQLQNKLFHKGYYDSNVYAAAVTNYNLKDKLELYEDHVLYGEIYGDGIQKGYTYGCKLGERKLVIFDVMVKGKYMDHEEMEEFIIDKLGLETAPVLFHGEYDAVKAKELTVGNSVLAPTQKVREGVVIRPVKETIAHMGRKVLKLISDQYLLNDNTDFH